MCLVTNLTKIKVATRDIKCYKVFQTFSSLTGSERASAIHRNGRGAFESDTLVSPYQFYKYEIGKEYMAPNFDDYGLGLNHHSDLTINGDLTISENAIHTYRNKKWAKKCAAFLRGCDIPKSSVVIVECVIPEGSSYALGKTGQYIENDNSYASEKLILKAIVPEEKK